MKLILYTVLISVLVCRIGFSAGFNETLDIRGGNSIRIYSKNATTPSTIILPNELRFDFGSIYGVQDGGRTTDNWYIPSVDIPSRYDGVNYGQLYAVALMNKDGIKSSDNSGKLLNKKLTFGTEKNFIYGNAAELVMQSVNIRVNAPFFSFGAEGAMQLINMYSLTNIQNSTIAERKSDVIMDTANMINLNGMVMIDKTKNRVIINGDMSTAGFDFNGNQIVFQSNKKINTVGSKLLVNAGGGSLIEGNSQYLKMAGSGIEEYYEAVNVGQLLQAINQLRLENSLLNSKVNELETWKANILEQRLIAIEQNIAELKSFIGNTITPPPPTENFTATTIGDQTIRVTWSWDGAEPGTKIIVIRNTTGMFVNNLVDGTEYSVGDEINGGTVVFIGSRPEKSFIEKNLAPSTTYYYQAFMFNIKGKYSDARTASATTN